MSRLRPLPGERLCVIASSMPWSTATSDARTQHVTHRNGAVWRPDSGANLVASSFFGAVQRPVGGLDHLLPLCGPVVLVRDADADRDRHPLPGPPVGQHLLLLFLGAEPRAQDEARVFHGPSQVVQIRDAFLGGAAREDDGELLAAVAVRFP